MARTGLAAPRRLLRGMVTERVESTGTMNPELLLNGVRDSRLVAIVRGSDGRAAAKAALVAMEEGFRYVEIALTTPGALQAISEVRAAAPAGCFVGAGTVLTVRDVDNVLEAGGQFTVTPALAESVDESARQGIPVLAGAMTPSEAYEAMNRGATAVKLFPASIGGPQYLKALRDPFPDIPFIAVGGVGLEQAAAYWDAGAIAVGLGGPLFGDAGSGGDLAPVRSRARSFVDLAAGSTGGCTAGGESRRGDSRRRPPYAGRIHGVAQDRRADLCRWLHVDACGRGRVERRRGRCPAGAPGALGRRHRQRPAR
jgi:2-dehydro-3-deoxyphosphogluconate aldolase/(4S)-4-hydroxy-2-oxoglutarate aldolase